MTTRPVFCRITSYRAVFIIRTVLLLVALFVLILGGATDALAQGTISGTVSSSTPRGLPNGEVHFYDLTGDTGPSAGHRPDEWAGLQYTISLPPSTVRRSHAEQTGAYQPGLQQHNRSVFGGLRPGESLTIVIVTNGSAFSRTSCSILADGLPAASRTQRHRSGYCRRPGLFRSFLRAEVFFTWPPPMRMATTSATAGLSRAPCSCKR